MKGKKPQKPEGAVLITGKRKRAVAKAWFTPGKGRVMINAMPLELIKNELVRLKIQEPLLVVGDGWKKFDVHVSVKGGGIVGQADAARQAISRGLVTLLPETKETFLKYDRFMLVYDPRRTEPHKPPRSSQGPRRHKQRSKR